MMQAAPMSLWEMLELHARPFLDALHCVTSLSQSLVGRPDKGLRLPRSDFDELHEHMLALRDACGALGANVTLISVERALKIMDETTAVDSFMRFDEFQMSKIKAYLSEASGRLRDELGQYLMITVSGDDQRLYLDHPSSLFGDGVAEKFPEAAEDIEEAAKCLALGRYTACAFHLMRAMENPTHAVGKLLGVPLARDDGREKTWGQIVNEMRPKINALPYGESRRNWDEIAGMLHAVNEAWRVPTAHPKRTYTEPQARELYQAVRAFMRRLAEAC